ncbi:steroid dehydrogenase [Penicillium hispanicum]|uniref:steroid dehydrogenase n=1 Tax=Penicillium hispanicum TaxID=1080232 RepID=UPI0025425261|nr:steroid dehydrogenase [Penicillium hispanicum]KAJ5595248.1 steroid dehydrogenase [Penicillium hispanicum]
MGVTWSQFFPPTPTLTEANLPSQKGKVFIVTGGYSGVGLELCKILYRAGGKVYLAGRSEEKAVGAIADIKASHPSPDGDVVFLFLSLDDLTTIKPAVETFTAVESRLDVLFNNAGVSNPPRGSVSPQGHDLQLATNCLGPHLLTQLLLPTLKRTAQDAPSASVRVVWLASIVVDLSAPADGVKLEDLLRRDTHPQRNYENTKVGNWYLANALATQAGSDGILSLVVNPGSLKTALTRHLSPWVPFLAAPLLFHPRMGAYTELWAGLSSDLTASDGGKYILPWGRLHPSPRADLVQAMKTKADGGTGTAATFVQYCDDQISEFK